MEVHLKHILLLSAYHAQSHRYWSEALIRNFPEYKWTLLSLPPRYFSWRIRGNPLSFMQKYPQELAQAYDLCIATSMVDLCTLRALIPGLNNTRCMLYFHENQFAYPASEHQRQSLEPQMVTLYSALAADQLGFNSDYNCRSFLLGVERLMQSMPDHAPRELSERLRQKSAVLPVPLEVPAEQSTKPTPDRKRRSASARPPRLLWNHRWEYDKGPDLLLEIIGQLEHSQRPYQLAIVGQRFRQVPAQFEAIQTLIEASNTLELVQWGYLASRDEYARCLRDSDLVLSTALHDFQGLAVLEAVAAGCTPILPDRLVYPEWFDSDYLYRADADVRGSAEAALKRIEAHTHDFPNRPIPDIHAWSWEALRPKYREAIAELIGAPPKDP